MQLTYIIPSLSAILALTSAAPSPLVARSSDFIGTGQIIMEHDTDGTNMGCLTVDGLLTVDTSLCGTFTGAYASDSTSEILLSTGSGVCGVYSTGTSVDFTCGADASSGTSQTNFATIVRGNQTNVFTGDLEYDYAPYEDVFPTGSETTSIHLWGGEDSGDFLTMNWSAL